VPKYDRGDSFHPLLRMLMYSNCHLRSGKHTLTDKSASLELKQKFDHIYMRRYISNQYIHIRMFVKDIIIDNYMTAR